MINCWYSRYAATRIRSIMSACLLNVHRDNDNSIEQKTKRQQQKQIFFGLICVLFFSLLLCFIWKKLWMNLTIKKRGWKIKEIHRFYDTLMCVLSSSSSSHIQINVEKQTGLYASLPPMIKGTNSDKEEYLNYASNKVDDSNDDSTRTQNWEEEMK